MSPAEHEGRAGSTPGPHATSDGASVDGGLGFRFEERFLDEMLSRMWTGSAFRRRQRMALDAIGIVGGEASALLHCPRLRLQRKDGGLVRLDCSAHVELSLGLPGLGRRFAVRGAVLVEPRLETAGPLRFVLAADFGTARLRDLRVQPAPRRGGWGFDPLALDPFAEWRLVELGKLVVQRLLEGFGERRLELDASALPEWAAAALSGSDPARLRIGDGWVELEPTPGLARRERGVESAASLQPARAGLPTPGLQVRVPEAAVERAMSTWLAREVPQLRCEELVVRFDRGILEVHSSLRPALDLWPRWLVCRTTARLAVGRSDDRLWAVVEGLVIQTPRVLVAAASWLARGLRSRLEARALTRELAPPGMQRDLGRLRIADVRLEPGGAEVELRLLRHAPSSGEGEGFAKRSSDLSP